MRFIVRDPKGNNVTSEKEWYVDSNGNLYFMTNDIDDPLVEADGYDYEIDPTSILNNNK